MKLLKAILCLLCISQNLFSQSNELVFPKTDLTVIPELDGNYLNVFTNHKYENENIISCKWYDVAKGMAVNDYKPALNYLGVLLFRFNDTKLISTETIKINPDKKYIPLEVYETYQVGNTINLLTKLYDKEVKEVYFECFSYDLKNKTTSNKRLVTVKKGTDMVIYKDKGNDNVVCLTGTRFFLDLSDNFKTFNYFVFDKNLDLLNQGENITMQNPAKQEAIATNDGTLLFCNMINNSLSGKRAYKLEFFKINKNEVKKINFNGEPYMSNAKFIVDDNKIKITCLAKNAPVNIFNSILLADVDLATNSISNSKVSTFKNLSNTLATDENENDKKADDKFEKMNDNETCNLPRMTCIMDIIYGNSHPTIFIDRLYQDERKVGNTIYKTIEMGYGALLNTTADNNIDNYAVLKYSASYSNLDISKSPCKPKKLSNGKILVNKEENSLLLDINKKIYKIGGFGFSMIVPDYYFIDGSSAYQFRYDWSKEKVGLSKKEIQ